jgi:hypothetical protein
MNFLIFISNHFLNKNFNLYNLPALNNWDGATCIDGREKLSFTTA